MPDRDELIELLPHYVVMILLVFILVGLIRSFTGQLHLLVEFAIVFGIVVLYRQFVVRFDVVSTPAIWESSRE